MKELQAFFLAVQEGLGKLSPALPMSMPTPPPPRSSRANQSRRSHGSPAHNHNKSVNLMRINTPFDTHDKSHILRGFPKPKSKAHPAGTSKTCRRCCRASYPAAQFSSPRPPTPTACCGHSSRQSTLHQSPTGFGFGITFRQTPKSSTRDPQLN